MSNLTRRQFFKRLTSKARHLTHTKYFWPLVILAIGPTTSLYILRHSIYEGRPSNLTIVADCSTVEKVNDFKCWDSRLTALTTNDSPEAAFQDLKPAYQASPYIQSQCHQLVHRIGRAAVTKYPTVAEAYNHGDNFCWSGYYHGVMEAVAAKLGRDGIINDMNGICAELRQTQQYSFFHYNCVHGLGHGVMGITTNELFESLEVCDRLDDGWEGESCYGGVFMENIMSEDNPDHRTKYLRSDEPMYPCTAVANKFKYQCYLMQSSYALKLSGYDFAKVFEQCAAIETDYQATCYQSVGRDASGTSTSDSSRTRANCLKGQDQFARENCVIGAVKDFISYFHDIKPANTLCDAVSADGLGEICRSTATEYYKSF